MATNYIHTEVVFDCISGLPADQFVHTWNARSDVLTAANLHTQFTANLVDFYNSANTHRTIAQWLSDAISRTASSAEMRSYDVGANLDGSPTGFGPVGVRTWTLGAGFSSAMLPNEVAACLSFRTLGVYPRPPSGPNQASRHSGRVFIGPLDQAAISDGASGGVLDPWIQTDLAVAAGRLGLGTGNATWAVWSRANASMIAVKSGYIDDAPDTQRRRGEKSLARTQFVL